MEPRARTSRTARRPRRLLPLAAGAAVLAAAAPAAAAPHVVKTCAIPRQHAIGGFGHAGISPGPGRAIYAITMGNRYAPAYAGALLRITAACKVTTYPYPRGVGNPGGIAQVGGALWVSATRAGRAVSLVSRGAAPTVHPVASGLGWERIATLGGTAYGATGFADVISSTDGVTFAIKPLTGMLTTDVTVFGGTLWFSGSASPAGIASLPSLAGDLAITSAGMPAGYQSELIAGTSHGLWLSLGNGARWRIGHVANGRIVSRGMSSVIIDLRKGPDGWPWVATRTAVYRLGADGRPTATIAMPRGYRPISLAPLGRYLWVAAVQPNAGAGVGMSKVLAISMR